MTERAETHRLATLVSAALADGRIADAESAALAAVSAGAETPLLLRLAAAAHQRRGGLEDARRLYVRAVNAAPSEPDGWLGLAAACLAAQRPEAAIQVCDEGLKRLPTSASLMVAKAQALQSLSRVEAAAALFRSALTLDADHPGARLGLAGLALEAGDLDGAESLAASMLARAPNRPDIAWLGARIALDRGEAEAARSRAAVVLGADGLAPLQRAEAELLMGEALDRLGRPAQAFEAFQRGKSALRGYYAERAAGREAETDKLNRLAAWFAATDHAPWREPAPPTASTGGVRGHAFLIGFPRSGTTLLEQALAGHPDLVSLEEAPTLADAYDALMTTSQGLERLERLGPEEAEAWRAAYWTEVGRGGVNPRGKLFLDKAPAGTLCLPLIAKLFPGAKVLFALRDPRDVALSCFRNNFQMNALTYAFTDLAETARCYGACMAMAQVYRRVLPVNLTEVRYETLVADFEAELGRIAAFLGLDLTPEMMDVAATARRRVVRTPSARQVRAGLNREGLERWRTYERELAPVMDTLAPWIEAFGYDGAAG